MGRKSNIQRNKGFFYPACCLIFIWLLTGCQYEYYPKVSIENNKGEAGIFFLDRARDHAVKGEFEKAFEENAKAYDAFPVELKQVAIFQKALLHAHPDNMDQNYEKATVCFELVDEKPSDKIFEYNSVLIFSSLKGICDLAQKVSSSQQDILKGKKIIENRQNRIQALLEEQAKLKKYIARLREQINQLKEVDLSFRGENKGILK